MSSINDNGILWCDGCSVRRVNSIGEVCPECRTAADVLVARLFPHTNRVECELAEACERIRRLEAAGDAMECALGEWDPSIDRQFRMAWIEAKESAP